MTSQKKAQRTRKQFHPAFCCAAEFDFRDADAQLIFEKELVLNTSPNRIDLLIIHTSQDADIRNEIGAIFKKYNIFEYKSPEDKLGKNAFYISNAYANLLIGYSKGPTDLDEITVTFVRNSKPRVLIDFLKEKGYTVSRFTEGIYHVNKTGDFTRQIIVAKELGPQHRWLRAVGATLSPDEIISLAEESETMDEDDYLMALSILNTIKRDLDRKENAGMGKLEVEFAKKLRKLRKLEEQINEKEEQLNEKDEQLNEKDEQLNEKDEQLNEKDELYNEVTEQLKVKDDLLQKSEKENSLLRQELEKLKKLLDKPAMF